MGKAGGKANRMGYDNGEQKRLSWRMKLLIALTPLALLLTIGLMIDANGHRELKRAMADARADELLVTFEEVWATRKKWPDDQNGAFVILDLPDPLIGDLPEGVDELLPIIGTADPVPLGERWSDETLAAVAALLADKANELAQIDRLADYEGAQFPIVPTANPFNTPLLHVPPLRASAKLKTLQMQNRAMAGDTTNLLRDIAVLERHGRLLGGEPFLCTVLGAVAVDSLALRAIQTAVAYSELSPEQLTPLAGLVATMDDDQRMAWALRGERACFISAIGFYRSQGTLGMGMGVPTVPKVASRVPGFRGYLFRDEAMGIGLYNNLVAGAAIGRREAMQAAAANDATVVAMKPWQYPLTRALMPSFSRAIEIDIRYSGEVRATCVALAAERYRMNKGDFPSKLEDLVPAYLDAVPLDPFDEKPLRYRVDKDAVIIYTVGEDGTDDGGDVFRGGDNRPSDYTDFGFVLLKPEFRNRPYVPPPDVTQDVGK